MTDFDPVNKPKHYNLHPSGLECIQLTQLCPFSLGNAIKYVWRAGEKGNAIEDVRKALWYLDNYQRSLQADPLVPDAPPQRLRASLVAMQVQHGRDGHLEGFLRALYGREVESPARVGAGSVLEAEHRFVTIERIEIAKLYLEWMIGTLQDEELLRKMMKQDQAKDDSNA